MFLCCSRIRGFPENRSCRESETQAGSKVTYTHQLQSMSWGEWHRQAPCPLRHPRRREQERRCRCLHEDRSILFSFLGGEGAYAASDKNKQSKHNVHKTSIKKSTVEISTRLENNQPGEEGNNSSRQFGTIHSVKGQHIHCTKSRINGKKTHTCIEY